MRSGPRGDNVLLLQEVLRERGALITADGRFGSGTRTAVRAFQRSAGLRVTGVVDTATAKALGW